LAWGFRRTPPRGGGLETPRGEGTPGGEKEPGGKERPYGGGESLRTMGEPHTKERGW